MGAGDLFPSLIFQALEKKKAQHKLDLRKTWPAGFD